MLLLFAAPLGDHLIHGISNESMNTASPGGMECVSEEDRKKILEPSATSYRSHQCCSEGPVTFCRRTVGPGRYAEWNMTCTPELHCAGPASRDCLRPHRLQAFVFTAARAFTCSPSCAARLPSAPPSLTLPPSARIATSHVQGVPLINEQEDFGVSSIPRT